MNRTAKSVVKGQTLLENLQLPATQVTDAGLPQLRGLSKLRYLNLGGTKVTDAAKEALDRALPRRGGSH